MLKIPEYQIWTKIHESPNSRVYRGIRDRDRLAVIFKILQKDYPTPEEITRYKLECEITRNLSLEGVIKVYGLQQYQSTFVIILEDFGGESLAKIIAKKRFYLIEFLKLAVQITEVLGEIHNANIIHKDINPSNIVLNLETQQLKIIDFGISTTRSHEILTLKNPTVLEGTLAYISPEQTGRMNRSLDYRTDFYSLGITLDQLLTHHLPFESSDALELIHYHLALQPVPPHIIERQYSELLELRSPKTRTPKLDITQSAATKLEALDLETVLKASQAMSATGYAYGSIGETVAVLQSIPLELVSADSNLYLPTALINYVARTQESMVFDNAAQFGNFQSEPWIVQRQSKSILCTTLLNQGKLTGIVLLENNLTASAFTPERIEILHLLSTQAAISIDNARLLKQQAELNESLQAEIAERKQAEKDRNRLITIMEASTDYISMADPQGNVLWNNSQANKLTEMPLDQGSDFRIPNSHPQWALDLVQNQGIPTAIRDGTWIGETALLDSNGREIPVSQLIIAHKASDGSLEYLSSVTRDISVIKAAEAEVRQLNAELEERVIERTDQLEAANKALEAFSYSVSHDLRTPLRAINGFSRMIQEDYGKQLDSEANRYLKIVRESAKRMGELIDDLLNLSRLDRQEMSRQPVIVNELIQMILSDLAPDLEGREIEFTIANLPECQADISLLKQVWINLLSNAIKYTSYKSPAYIEVGYEIMDGEGVYFIKDNGAGFDMRYADKLFGVFQRLHREEEFTGTGIGLAIAQRIIQRHGGRIWAKAAIDQGATFYFTLPNNTLGIFKPESLK